MLLDRDKDKMLLYLSPTVNTMWVEIYGRSRFKKTRFDAEVVGDNCYLGRWQRGMDMSDNTPTTIFLRVERLIGAVKDPAVKASLLARHKRFRAGFESGRKDFDLHAAAEALNIDIEHVYAQAETLQQKRLTIFPGLFYEKSQKHLAEVAFEEHRGAWAMFIARRERRRTPLFLAAALHVHSLAKVQEGFGLRVTLHIPIINMRAHTEWFKRPREPWFRYTGFLHVRSDHLVLKCAYQPDLVRGGDRRPDEFDAIFHEKRAEGDVITLKGKYLTMGQGSSRESIADELVLRRVSPDNETEIERVMGTPHVVTASEELTNINALFGLSARKKARSETPL